MKSSLYLLEKRHGQIWALDLFLVLFFFALLLFLFPSWSLQQTSTHRLAKESILLGNLLLTQGIPPDWNTSTVLLPGIVTEEGHLNRTKLFSFSQLSSEQLQHYPIDHPFVFWFVDHQGKNVTFFNQTRFGFINQSSFFEQAHAAAINDRIVFFNGTLLRIRIVVWEPS